MTLQPAAPQSMKNLALASLLASVASLLFAYISEYGFGLKPCELCIFQRVPYGVVILLAGLVLWRAGAKARHWLCALIGIAFLVGGGIGTYHSAVEKKLIKGPVACTSEGGTAGLTTEQILAKIQGAPIVACDQPQFEVYGVTMAMMNAVWSTLLGIAVFVALHKIRRSEKGLA